MYPTDHTVTIVSNNCLVADDTEPVTPGEPSEEGTDIEGEMKPVKEEKRDKDLILYCSLGVNAILLVALIVSLITRKKKVEPAPTPAPVVDEKNNQNNE